MTRASAAIKTTLAAAVLALPSVLAAQTFKTEKYNIGGDGNFDYLTAEPTTGRVYISRGSHVMVVDGMTGKVLNDIKDTPRVHGIAFAPKWNLGFTTNAGDSSVTMFDMKTMEVKKKIKAGKDGLDGIMYDESTDKILTINHSKPMGTAVVIDAKTGDVVATIALSGTAPEGGVSNGKGKIYINEEHENSIDVIDTKTWKVTETWKIDPCDGPTGIAMDRTTNRIFSGCSKKSVVVDAGTGKIVAEIVNGDIVDAIGYDVDQKMIYIPSGEGNVTVVHMDSPTKFTTVATVPTAKGARTITIDPSMHMAYVFTTERGPSTPSTTGGRATPGPITAAWLISIKH